MSVAVNDVAVEAAFNSAVQPQCQFFVLRKKRLCRMTVRPGRQYCGEHEPQPSPEHPDVDKRVPCPNDPKHTCYVSKLEKHLTKCNARQVEDPSYIVRNINAPKDEDSTPRAPLKDVPADTLQQVIEKVNLLYEKHVKSKMSTYRAPAEHHPAVVACIAQEDRTDSSRRHLRQASRLMQLAEDERLVAPGTCYVELGAGKGMLSYYMGRAWCDEVGAGAGAGAGSRVLCVDRASLRHKRDNLVAARASRLRADLRHLALHRAPALAPCARVVGLAKHLCGVATDYAVRCVCADGVRRRARGLLLATCCHHRCERSAYVGSAALQELGISGDELNIMFGIVSWATCGDGRSREMRLAGPALPPAPHPALPPAPHPALPPAPHPALPPAPHPAPAALGPTPPDARSDPRPSTPPHRDNDKNSAQTENEDLVTKKKPDTNMTRSVSALDTQTGCDVVTEKVSDTNDSDQETSTNLDTAPASFLPLPVNVREEIGRRAKALIDYGRVLYLREQGFEARLCYYVPTTESLENVCIVAKKDVPLCG